MPASDSIEQNLLRVLERVNNAALRCGRDPASVRVVAVSKKMPPEAVLSAARAGATLFGENYIQEARDKIAALAAERLSWHFIGKLQTNKAKYAAKLFTMIHTVDSEALAVELDRRMAALGSSMPVLLQVNVAGEQSKSGTSPEAAPDLARRVAELPNLELRGLMTMPPYDDPEKSRPHFAALAALARRIRDLGLPGVSMHELSMGMSHDLEAAVAEGATLVRVGTAIFGERE
ncbi:MAG: YggS family pyridoxal phosphate-dependent enzyme [Thermodesulfobacteriota bacterium]